MSDTMDRRREILLASVSALEAAASEAHHLDGERRRQMLNLADRLARCGDPEIEARASAVRTSLQKQEHTLLSLLFSLASAYLAVLQ